MLRRALGLAGAASLTAVSVVLAGPAAPASADMGIGPWVKPTIGAAAAAGATTVATGAEVVAAAEAITGASAAAIASAETAAAVGGTTVAVSGSVVVGAALAVGTLMYVGWKLGDGPISDALRSNDDVLMTAANRTRNDWSISGENAGAFVSTVPNRGQNQAIIVTVVKQASGDRFGVREVTLNGVGPTFSQWSNANAATTYPYSEGMATLNQTSAAGTVYVVRVGWNKSWCSPHSWVNGPPSPDPAWCGRSDHTPYLDPTQEVATITLTKLPGTNPDADTPGQPVGGSANPARVITTTRTCVNPSSGATTVHTADSAQFHNTDPTRPAFPVPGCENGTVPQSSKTVIRTVTPGAAPDFPLVDWDPKPADEPAVAAGVPVELVRVLPDGSTETCEQTPSPCAKWYESPTKTETYRCMQGGVQIALSECEAVRTRYDPVPRTPVDPKPTDPQDFGNCVGGWSWNPVDWVFTPVKCALVWAFVPPAGTFTLPGVDFCETAPGVISCAIGDVLAPWTHLGEAGSSGCLGGAVTVPTSAGPLPDSDDDITIHPFQACEEVTSTMSELWLGISSAGLYLATFLLAGQRLAKTIGAEDAVPT